jgi:hypothetical protein
MDAQDWKEIVYPLGCFAALVISVAAGVIAEAIFGDGSR